MIRLFLLKLLVFVTCLGLLNSCRQTQKRTLPEKIKFYESRARTFQTLADLQRLTPPYSSHTLATGQRLHHQQLRSIYLNKAKKYRNLAKRSRNKQVPRKYLRLKGIKERKLLFRRRKIPVFPCWSTFWIRGRWTLS